MTEKATIPDEYKDLLDAQLRALALSLAQLAQAPLPARERRALAPRLRALRELIGAALDPKKG